MSEDLLRLPVIHDVPAHQLLPERLLLYALVYGLRPARALEIGTLHGGSAMIICAAMDDLGRGRLACVDPEPAVSPEHWQSIEHRATLVRGHSPEALTAAADAVGGPFDFALIDGDHSREGVVRDVEGLLDVLADQAWLLLHDAHFLLVREAVDEVLAAHPGQLHDAGVVSAANVEDAGDPTMLWGGLRLLRRTATPSTRRGLRARAGHWARRQLHLG